MTIFLMYRYKYSPILYVQLLHCLAGQIRTISPMTLTFIKSFVIISLCPIIILSPAPALAIPKDAHKRDESQYLKLFSYPLSPSRTNPL
jgi:hypothetical protein